MIEPKSPLAENPIRLKTKPPMKAPTIPMTISVIKPAPPPFISLPASQPAIAPMAKNITSSIMVPCGGD
jgi:hypothetical protein